MKTRIEMVEVTVGGDEVSDPGCDPDITCKDVLTVVSDVCEDTNNSAEDDGNTDAASLKVHMDTTELGTVPRIRIYLEERRKYLPWFLLVLVGSLLTIRTVRLIFSIRLPFDILKTHDLSPSKMFTFYIVDHCI